MHRNESISELDTFNNVMPAKTGLELWRLFHLAP